MKMICMAVMLFITLLSAGAQKNIPASDIKVAMMKATRFMVEKVSNRGGYLWKSNVTSLGLFSQDLPWHGESLCLSSC